VTELKAPGSSRLGFVTRGQGNWKVQGYPAVAGWGLVPIDLIVGLKVKKTVEALWLGAGKIIDPY
jgi:hypothetical protein